MQLILNVCGLAVLSFGLLVSAAHSIWAATTEAGLLEVTINDTTFRLAQRFVGYYDEKNHSVLAIYFLLPEVLPIEPFSIGAVQEHKPTQVANVAILASKYPDYSQYLDHLSAQGLLTTKDYGFGLGELSPTVVPGPTQRDPKPDVREFLTELDGQRILIVCSGLRSDALLRTCQFTYAAQGYALKIEIPFSYLPEWKTVFSTVISYTKAHEVN